MFQNISYEEEFKEENKRDKKLILKEIFNLKNIFLYIVSFLVSMIGFGDMGSPFALAIFAATCSNNIPSGVVYILSGLGVLIKFGTNSFLIYILTTLIFIIGTIVLKPEVKDRDRNEQKKLGGYIFLSTALVQVISLFFGEIYLYNVLVAFASSILTYVFYKIFSNAIVVIREYREKAAFSIEEIMAASILITVAISALGDLNIFGFSITNIICILMILVLGWKNGVLVGVTAGTTIGVISGIIGGQEPILVAAYAISGLMARNIK